MVVIYILLINATKLLNFTAIKNIKMPIQKDAIICHRGSIDGCSDFLHIHCNYNHSIFTFWWPYGEEDKNRNEDKAVSGVIDELVDLVGLEYLRPKVTECFQQLRQNDPNVGKHDAKASFLILPQEIIEPHYSCKEHR